MATTIFEITARVPTQCNDGRNPAAFWGHETQYHAVRTTAESALRRLQDGGAYGCDPPLEYAVVEVTRADFPPDEFGTDEWKRACRQAGVDPESA